MSLGDALLLSPYLLARNNVACLFNDTPGNYSPSGTVIKGLDSDTDVGTPFPDPLQDLELALFLAL